MTTYVSKRLVPLALQLGAVVHDEGPDAVDAVSDVVHSEVHSGVGLCLARPETLNGQDAALGARHTRGPLTPSEPVRTSELP